MFDPQRNEEGRVSAPPGSHADTAHHEDGPVPKFLYLVYAGIAAFFVYYLIVYWRG
ncbi:MAG: hypothetical protein ACM3ZA_12880 [Bacillota bacterium]